MGDANDQSVPMSVPSSVRGTAPERVPVRRERRSVGEVEGKGKGVSFEAGGPLQGATTRKGVDVADGKDSDGGGDADEIGGAEAIGGAEEVGDADTDVNVNVTSDVNVEETVKVVFGDEDLEGVMADAMAGAVLRDAKNNEYVLAKRGDSTASLDARLIRDLVVTLAASCIGGLVYSGGLNQPALLGYIMAGAVIGPGGVGAIAEQVQVGTLAQLGVVFLMFEVGLQVNMARIGEVRGVALVGGALCVAAQMLLTAWAAHWVWDDSASKGAFVGAFTSMSSTAVVVKCLEESPGMALSAPGRIIMGTLVLQDLAVGLLLATVPLLVPATLVDVNDAALQGYSGHGVYELLTLVVGVAVKMTAFGLLAAIMSRLVLGRFLRMLDRLVLHTKSGELLVLALVSLCLCSALVSDRLKLSLEVGAFIAGVSLAAAAEPTASEHLARTIEPVRHLFCSLFFATVGMMLDPQLLLRRIDVIFAAVLCILTGKATLQAGLVVLFGYPLRVALTVGLALAQVGEFALVLLALGRRLDLIDTERHLVYVGTTVLSLLATPLVFKAGIPAAMHLVDRLGVLHRHDGLPLCSEHDAKDHDGDEEHRRDL